LEDINEVVQHADFEDPWKRMIVKGKPTDLPEGPCVEYLGKYVETTKPCGQQSLEHWNLSPWASQFEEQMQPAPLDPTDNRIKEAVPLNLNGKPSLLLKPNGAMCSQLPKMDEKILKTCVEQMSKEYIAKIGFVNTCSSDMETLLDEAVNGHATNEFCKGMVLEKSCGIPWNGLPGVTKKSDFLLNTDGNITFKEGNGEILKKRITEKIVRSNQGQRLISFSNSKLKDAQVKISAVEAGKTRVFHCIPVDKVITDAALYGHFKESYTKAFLNLNHTLGVNPHSSMWKDVYEHLTVHPNIFDLDFTNYDKYLHQDLLNSVYDIIHAVIDEKAADEWKQARKVLANESIETYVIDYDTVYKTTRGNKSGEYLTTIVNCIANDILSFYSWIKLTEINDISIYRDNSSLVSFGDDKVQSVSDDYKEIYNYYTMKKVMTEIGHKITPGSKDGIERAFCSIDQIQFLKRGFDELDGQIVAPLLTRSIECPFVWTRIEDSEEEIWKNLIEMHIFEAVLHGEEYYNKFVKALRSGTNEALNKVIAPLTSVPFSIAKVRYFRFYHE
jgi:hypothetical protein